MTNQALNVISKNSSFDEVILSDPDDFLIKTSTILIWSEEYVTHEVYVCKINMSLKLLFL